MFSHSWLLVTGLDEQDTSWLQEQQLSRITESFSLEKACKNTESNYRFKDNDYIMNIKESVRRRKIQ